LDIRGTSPLRSDLEGIRPGVETLQQGSLADPNQAKLIETAILEHCRVRLLR
jgi:hypothetical protein